MQTEDYYIAACKNGLHFLSPHLVFLVQLVETPLAVTRVPIEATIQPNYKHQNIISEGLRTILYILTTFSAVISLLRYFIGNTAEK